MTAADILAELKKLGNESTKNTLLRHGAKEPFYGVKIEDLKKIQKRVKKDHALALALYDTGVSDAMYLAALICDPRQMTRDDLRRWAENATWQMLSEYTVAWAAAESPYARALALEWIDSPQEKIASSGWSTYSSYVAITPDEALDLVEIATLLDRVLREIPDAPNRVKYTMNGFVIAVADEGHDAREEGRLGEAENRRDVGGGDRTAAEGDDLVEQRERVAHASLAAAGRRSTSARQHSSSWYSSARSMRCHRS